MQANERILSRKIKEYKRIIVIPRERDELMGRECCITKQQTTGIQLLRQSREEYNVCISEDVKTPVSLTEAGTDSYLACLAASGYAIITSLIIVQSNQTYVSSWAYLPTELSDYHKDRLRSYLSEQDITSIDATYFVSLKEGEVQVEDDMFQKKLSREDFLEMLDESEHKRLERRRPSTPGTNQ